MTPPENTQTSRFKPMSTIGRFDPMGSFSYLCRCTQYYLPCMQYDSKGRNVLTI